MTDEQIIKALECCIVHRESHCCDNRECPYFNKTAKYSECQKMLLEDITNLINRLKQENEELKRDAKYSEEFKKIVEKYTGGKP